ncbi:MAG: lysophospholipid acyltransferase family protein [Bacteroidota bacterium]|nr:lysophospholipid acyltransferase family protein [Bacteroidota bacterium]
MLVGFYLFKSLAWIISKLPFYCLYRFSDFLSFLLFYIFRYRKTVVFQNLQNAFPDKDHKEIRKIARKYYRNLADIILEVIKLRSITTDQLLKRFSFENIEIIRQLSSQGKSIIMTLGHCGNWEWMGIALGLITEQKGYAIVKPLSDKRFDKYMTFLRTRLYKDSMIPFKETFRTLIKNKEHLTINAFAADQTPTKSEINYWGKFLNQETGFFTGIEKIAMSLDMGVVFIDIQRVGRGQYKGIFSLITDQPKEAGEQEIIKKYVSLLEQSIIKSPDNWLWSHKRWKHKREDIKQETQTD